MLPRRGGGAGVCNAQAGGQSRQQACLLCSVHSSLTSSLSSLPLSLSLYLLSSLCLLYPHSLSSDMAALHASSSSALQQAFLIHYCSFSVSLSLPQFGGQTGTCLSLYSASAGTAGLFSVCYCVAPVWPHTRTRGCHALRATPHKLCRHEHLTHDALLHAPLYPYHPLPPPIIPPTLHTYHDIATYYHDTTFLPR